MSRECSGLPSCRGPCPLCLGLWRIAELGHQGILSPANYSGLVNRVRILYGEVLDLLPGSGQPSVAAGGSRVERPPGQWEAPGVKGHPKQERSGSHSPEEKAAEEEKLKEGEIGGAAGETTGHPRTEPSDSDKEEAEDKELNAEEEPAKSEEEKKGDKEGDLSPEEQGEEDSERSQRTPEKAKKSKKKKHSKKGKDHKERKKDRHQHRPHRHRHKDKEKNEPIGASPRLKEELAALSRPLKLRPKSPSYPPPARHQPKDREEKFESEASEDSRDYGRKQEDPGETRYRSYWRENQARGWEEHKGKKRSKGQTRLQRWEDIRTFGPDPSRKKLREAHQASQWW